MLYASVALKAGKQTGPLQIQHRERKIGIKDNIQNQVTAVIITDSLLTLHVLYVKQIRPTPKARSGPFLSDFPSISYPQHREGQSSENRQCWVSQHP